MAQSGGYKALRGENCTLTNIRGIKVLEDEHGVDLIKLIKKAVNKNSDSDTDSSILNIMSRLESLEKYVKNMPLGVAGPAGPRGEKGEKGEDGEGTKGDQGPRGKDGAKMLSELKDVCLDGLDDGMILVYSEKDKKWTASKD
jgi:hypothetical protein